MFGLSFEKLIVIGLIAVMIVGPTRLPVYAAKLAQFVKSLTAMANAAKDRVQTELGPEFEDLDWKKLDPRQYDPRRIIREALLDDYTGESAVVLRPSTSAAEVETAAPESGEQELSSPESDDDESVSALPEGEDSVSALPDTVAPLPEAEVSVAAFQDADADYADAQSIRVPDDSQDSASTYAPRVPAAVRARTRWSAPDTD